MRRLGPDDDFAALHALLAVAFAYMEGRIDPPSSLTRMTAETLSTEAREKEIWVIEDGARTIACMILTPHVDTLYLGKLATDPARRREGLARRMFAQAEMRAKALGLPSITLQARVELTENHATFAAMGFEKTDETAHEGYARPTSYTFTKRL